MVRGERAERTSKRQEGILNPTRVVALLLLLLLQKNEAGSKANMSGATTMVEGFTKPWEHLVLRSRLLTVKLLLFKCVRAGTARHYM